jgi:hypothetical protein
LRMGMTETLPTMADNANPGSKFPNSRDSNNQTRVGCSEFGARRNASPVGRP